MANSGIKASQAGTSLRTIMNNLSGEVTFVGKNIGEVTIATSKLSFNIFLTVVLNFSVLFLYMRIAV